MFRPMFAAVALMLSLAACQAGSEPAPEGTDAAASEEVAVAPDRSIPESAGTANPGDARDTECGADKLGHWINAVPTDDTKAEIADAVGERPIRYYTQGDPITMDFSPARLNVELGADGRIKRFRCG